MIRHVVLALAALCAVTSTTHAGVILAFTESGGDVVATGSGSINTTGLTFQYTGDTASFVVAGGGTAYSGSAFNAVVDVYLGSVGPVSFGSGGYHPATFGSGDFLGTDVPYILVPFGYVSGATLSDSTTWTGATFASLGLTPGTYDYTFGSGQTADFFEVRIGSESATPEPATITMLGIGVAGLAGYRSRRRKGAVAD